MYQNVWVKKYKYIISFELLAFRLNENKCLILITFSQIKQKCK